MTCTRTSSFWALRQGLKPSAISLIALALFLVCAVFIITGHVKLAFSYWGLVTCLPNWFLLLKFDPGEFYMYMDSCGWKMRSTVCAVAGAQKPKLSGGSRVAVAGCRLPERCLVMWSFSGPRYPRWCSPPKWNNSCWSPGKMRKVTPWESWNRQSCSSSIHSIRTNLGFSWRKA